MSDASFSFDRSVSSDGRTRDALPYSRVSGDLANDPGPHAFANHPGAGSQACPLQYRVIADPFGSSSHGFGCHWNGWHCLPCDECQQRVEVAYAEVERWAAVRPEQEGTTK